VATFSNIAVIHRVTVNDTARGSYLPGAPRTVVIGPIVRSFYEPLGIQPAQNAEGVYARVINGRTLYVNTTNEEKDVAVGMKAHGVLSRHSYDGKWNWVLSGGSCGVRTLRLVATARKATMRHGGCKKSPSFYFWRLLR